MSTGALYGLLGIGVLGLTLCLAGLALVHVAMWRREP